MARLSALIAAGEVCCCLRSKQLFYDTDDHDREDAHHPAGQVSGPFWCTLTQSVIGPDGKVADVDDCRGGRGCCKTA